MIRFLAMGMLGLVWTGSCSSAMKPVGRDSQEKIVLDLGGGVKMEFVRIKAGKFTMGSNEYDDEKPPHEVTLTKDYWMQTTETTQAQWEAVMGKNPSKFKGADLPVEQVSWDDCREFMKKLNEKAEEQLNGKAAGLPTEAQWEYACRAGEKGRWCFGDDEKRLGDYAWCGDNADPRTYPVGKKRANAWGLYDMHGNVWEWCEDWYGEKYPSEAATDPTGPEKGEFRCLRGGCWGNRTRSAGRSKDQPASVGSDHGFRPALR
ncbi:MAG: SUMF1/EgtB/PvdO family nonheme iron enzyme [Planctomycetes bacterium]|nr:SUMF1/EgtB/PvdO family nonheme iron enzyme [Planctomycetota bacterium]